ncbi:nitrous oxide reductase accessory protein NosL [Flavobacterium sp.]|uniref:nitrous oxide reductase accessory protein NosL n=1 Tax=Flavobacterium sp. TaxID=239 RepID=UPI00286D79E0|nr:nitrous oxide reductase accessory protein NosL [Flavobacterium sp.]
MKHYYAIIVLFLIIACGSKEAQPIKINVDNCDFCGMSIADGKFGAEVITEKGRVFNFDDIGCMLNYCKENSNTKMGAYFVNDFSKDNELIPANTAFFLLGGSIQSPMRGGIIAFSKESEAKEFGVKLDAKPVTWEAILSK